MTYRGHVKNGAIQLDDRVEIPEGTEVTVEVVQKVPVRGSRSGLRAKLRKALALVNNRHGIPMFYALLLICFLVGNYFSALRDRVVAKCTEVLVIEGAETTDDLMVKLGHLNPRKGPTRESQNTEGAQAFSLIFPWPSALHLWLEFDPETREVLDYGLYVVSEKVDLTTHDGMLPTLNGIAIVFAVVAILMTVLFYAASGWGRLARCFINVLIVLTTLPMVFLALQVVGQCVIAWMESDFAAAIPVQTVITG
jgi:hypothetical protein